jgi:hypothetical protein
MQKVTLQDQQYPGYVVYIIYDERCECRFVCQLPLWGLKVLAYCIQYKFVSLFGNWQAGESNEVNVLLINNNNNDKQQHKTAT